MASPPLAWEAPHLAGHLSWHLVPDYTQNMDDLGQLHLCSCSEAMTVLCDLTCCLTASIALRSFTFCMASPNFLRSVFRLLKPVRYSLITRSKQIGEHMPDTHVLSVSVPTHFLASGSKTISSFLCFGTNGRFLPICLHIENTMGVQTTSRSRGGSQPVALE